MNHSLYLCFLYSVRAGNVPKSRAQKRLPHPQNIICAAAVFSIIVRFRLDIDHLGGRHHQHLACAAVNVHKAFSGSGGSNQSLSGTLHCKLQRFAPGNGVVSIYLEHVVLQRNLDKLLLRTLIQYRIRLNRSDSG